MQDTIRIHQRYGLTRKLFEEVIASVEEMPGTRGAVKTFRERRAVTAIISGAFKALADRAQQSLKVDHALAGCDYFFDPETGLLDHWNLLPSDYEGKVDFMRLIMKEYQARKEECAFIGDGQNDIPMAKEVGLSIAFNAQPELKQVCTYVIDQAPGSQDFRAVAECINRHAIRPEPR
jgi:phosphoserine phosphatase